MLNRGPCGKHSKGWSGHWWSKAYLLSASRLSFKPLRILFQKENLLGEKTSDNFRMAV